MEGLGKVIKIDFTGVRQETPPDGDYIFTISDAQEKPSKKGDSQVIHLQLEVDSPAEYAGRKTLAWISLHPDALWASQFFFDAVIGEPQDGVLEIEASNLVGEKVGATCEIETAPNGRKVLVPKTWWNPSSPYRDGDEPF